jgi:hypothetical protein
MLPFWTFGTVESAPGGWGRCSLLVTYRMSPAEHCTVTAVTCRGHAHLHVGTPVSGRERETQQHEKRRPHQSVDPGGQATAGEGVMYCHTAVMEVMLLARPSITLLMALAMDMVVLAAPRRERRDREGEGAKRLKWDINRKP